MFPNYGGVVRLVRANFAQNEGDKNVAESHKTATKKNLQRPPKRHIKDHQMRKMNEQ